MKYAILLFLFLRSTYSIAQIGILYNEPHGKSKFYVVISDNKNYDKLKNDIAKYTTKEIDKSFLLFKSENLLV